MLPVCLQTSSCRFVLAAVALALLIGSPQDLSAKPAGRRSNRDQARKEGKAGARDPRPTKGELKKIDKLIGAPDQEPGKRKQLPADKEPRVNKEPRTNKESEAKLKLKDVLPPKQEDKSELARRKSEKAEEKQLRRWMEDGSEQREPKKPARGDNDPKAESPQRPRLPKSLRREPSSSVTQGYAPANHGRTDQPLGASLEADATWKGEPPEAIRFNFRFQPWQDVLRWLADQARLSLVAQAVPQGTFNYTDDREYTPAQAIDLLNAVLETKGYMLVRRDRMLFLLNSENGIPPELIRDVPEADLNQRGQYELVRVRFPLDRITAEEAEQEVRQLVGPQGSVVALPASRQIVVTETAGRLRTIRDAVHRADDAQASSANQVRSFALKRLSPEEAVSVLRPLLDIPTDGSSSSDGSLRLAVDPRGWAILASGTPERLSLVEQIFGRIDVAEATEGRTGASPTPQLRTYTTTSTDSQSALAVLQTLLAGRPDVRLSVDSLTGNLIALAPPEDHAMIKSTLETLEHQPARVEAIRLSWLDPTAAAMAVKKFFGDSATDPRAPAIEASPTTRRLLVRGSDAEIAQIKTLLAGLGERSLVNQAFTHTAPIGYHRISEERVAGPGGP